MKKKIIILLSTMAVLALIVLRTDHGKYFYRYLILNLPDISDYKGYPSLQINKSETPFEFKSGEKISIDYTVPLRYKGKVTNRNLPELLKETKTTSFIVIKNDRLLFEEYYRGHSRATPHIMYSGTKSFISALIGIAIEEGHIKSTKEPVSQYFPEFDGKPEGEATINDLLNMTSGYKYVEGDFPWHDDGKALFTANILKTVMKHTSSIENPGMFHHYNNYNYLLLGLILRKATGVSASEYLEKKIWKKIGTEYDALWTLDNKSHKIERAMSGLAMRPVDLAKFGRLYLQGGKFENKAVVPASWILETTKVDTRFIYHSNFYTAYGMIQGMPWFKKGGYYKGGFWGYSENGKDYCYSVAGLLGQIMHIAPAKKLIVIRTGETEDNVDWMIDVIHQLAKRLPE
jgi:CubicO group peptidase (beta-lactamase class C family)